MPSLRPTYTYTKQSRGNSQKSPTSGCSTYALSRRGWRNKHARLLRHKQRLAFLEFRIRCRFPSDSATRLAGIQAEQRRTAEHLSRVSALMRG